MSKKGYDSALAALVLFSKPAAEQIAAARQQPSSQLPLELAEGCQPATEIAYFRGLACVFKSYQIHIFDAVKDAEELDVVIDFVHRLSTVMYDFRPEDWTASAVESAAAWAAIRRDAVAALRQLGVCTTSAVAPMNIKGLVYVDDFLPTAEARRLLG